MIVLMVEMVRVLAMMVMVMTVVVVVTVPMLMGAMLVVVVPTGLMSIFCHLHQFHLLEWERDSLQPD